MKHAPALITVAVALSGLVTAGALSAAAAPETVRGHQAVLGQHPAATVPSFRLELSQGSISLAPGGVEQKLTVVTYADPGFKGEITVKAADLPAGISIKPSTFTVAAGLSHDIVVTASASTKIGAGSIRLNAVSGVKSAAASLGVRVVASTNVSMNTNFFDFGNDFVKYQLIQTVVAVTNTGSTTLTLQPTLTGNAGFSIVTAKSCGTQLAAKHTCDMIVRYAPQTASAPKSQSAVLNMNFSNVPAGTLQTVVLHGTSAAAPVGIVTSTHNPQVALYSVTMPFPGKMTVNFGKTTAYGTRTWSQYTDQAGGTLSIFVAGMEQNTLYHMHALFQLSNGITVVDRDHTFTTGSITPQLNYQFQVTKGSGVTPQPGIELLNPLAGTVIVDLDGNPLWGYSVYKGNYINSMYGVKVLPNGDFLMTIGALSQSVTAPVPAGEILEIREVNLGGDTVKEVSIDDLNYELSTATCAECNVSLITFHHDVTPLPNGHWLVLANTIRTLNSKTNPPLTTGPQGPVLGDVIVDLDENLHPVWAWNEFNHLDPNRQPMGFPDWTHTNAVVYSPDDGNILVSLRHQNWVLKVNYKNGTGDGSILWHLGEGGDFKLVGGTDPTEWPYAQHAPSFTTPNTTGVFSLTLMDNGDDREFPTNVTCGKGSAPPCLYSTVPIYKVNESAKTATLTYRYVLPASIYNAWGGNAEVLANGHLEYDDCGLLVGSYVAEVTMGSSPKLVWQLHTGDTDYYRAFRIPSMYPGVQW